jgi:hypothetical protein
MTPPPPHPSKTRTPPIMVNPLAYSVCGENNSSIYSKTCLNTFDYRTVRFRQNLASLARSAELGGLSHTGPPGYIGWKRVQPRCSLRFAQNDSELIEKWVTVSTHLAKTTLWHILSICYYPLNLRTRENSSMHVGL